MIDSDEIREVLGMNRKTTSKTSVSRRQFLLAGGAAAAASGLPGIARADEEQEKPKIKSYRNYFDTAESYGNGDNERNVGEALQHMDRKKVFITTKLQVKDEDTQQTILDRFGKCQERLRTDYVDALYIHSAPTVSTLDNAAFHGAVKLLKADGRLRFAGVSNHGPRAEDEESMDKVLVAAAEDGRFDLMLIAYSFMNRDKGDKVLAACKKNNVGTTAMKTKPGTVKMEPLDPDNPSERAAKREDGPARPGQPLGEVGQVHRPPGQDRRKA